MRIAQLGWGIMRRTLVYGLTSGFVVGLLYGPISVLTLVALDWLGRTFAGTTAASQLNSSMLLTYVWTSFVGGSLFGVTIGILAGIVSGLLLTTLISVYLRRSSNLLHHVRAISTVNALAVGVITVWVTTGLNLPPLLSYDRLVVGWILWIVVPMILATVAGWLSSYQVVKSVIRSDWP